jgi:hypothetical protein
MEQATLVKIFLASPSDVKDERQMIFALKDDIDHLIGKPNKIRFEFVNWERSAYPGFGIDAQDVINTNIGDDYDIFVGIFWQRFGSPTNRAESGTKEEFDRAYEKFKNNPSENHILLYFKTASPSNIYELDFEQFQKVKSFKQDIGNAGALYWEFEKTDDLKNIFLLHLASLIKDKYINRSTKLTPIEKTERPLDKYEFLAKEIDSINADKNTEGIFELIEIVLDAMNELPSITSSLTNVINLIGHKFNDKTQQFNTVHAKIKDDRLKIKKTTEIVNKLAVDLNDYADQINVLLPDFSSLMGVAIESYTKLIFVYSESPLFVEEVNIQLETVVPVLYNSLDVPSGQIAEFLKTLNSLPSLTSKFATAKRNAELATNMLFKQFIKSRKNMEELINSDLHNKNRTLIN